MLLRALAHTAPLWPPVRLCYWWVHRAAHILKNEKNLCVEEIRREYRHLLEEMSSCKEEAGDLSGAVSLFLKVTKSYWKGLFHCYGFPEGTLPRTNNDLEHLFGSARYGERRATGRRGASPGLVVRGPVRLVAAVGTRVHGVTAADLSPPDVAQWRDLRRELEQRHAARRAQHRFRRDPAAYLAALEAHLLKPTLPP